MKSTTHGFSNKTIIYYFYNKIKSKSTDSERFVKILSLFKKYVNCYCFNLQEIILNARLFEFVTKYKKLNIPNEFCVELIKISRHSFLYKK